MIKQNSRVSIIIPVRNESQKTIDQLRQLLDLQGVLEIVVVDASDQSNTIHALQQFTNSDPRTHLIHSNRAGRSFQMNLGAKQASGEVLWFVHADTTVPKNAIQLIEKHLTETRNWGRFDVKFNSTYKGMRLVAWMMNLRSTITGMCTGDQAIFIVRELFQRVEGYPDIDIMEDIALSKILKKIESVTRIRTPVITSARRWEEDGYCRTIGKMWMMRLLYYFGVSPSRLAKMYRQVVS